MKLARLSRVLLPVLAATTWGAFAHAQETVPPAELVPVPAPEAKSETVTERGGPSRAELSSGLLTLGLTYGAGVVVAATSGRDADHRMFVPVAGPWMALFDRGDCSVAGRSCATETAYDVLIVADGIGQALGSLMIIGAFLHPEERTVTRSTTALAKPTIHLAPAAVSTGYGLAALGTF
jgi:hypothetical protein